MVHVGDARFYREAFQDAFSHDVALVEGVRSPVGRNLTRSYRWIDLERLGLVLQPKTPPRADVAARIVHADLSTEEFEQAWRGVSMRYRAMLFCLAPLVGIHRRLFASRETIADRLALEDLESREETLSWDPALAGIFEAVMDARDKRLTECLKAELTDASDTGKRIAIIYGALHMRAVLRELTRRGYTCVDAQWREAFAI